MLEEHKRELTKSEIIKTDFIFDDYEVMGQKENVKDWIDNPENVKTIKHEFDEVVKVCQESFSILDGGCYGGYLYDYINQHCSDFTYQGIDLNEKAVKESKKLHQNENFSIEVGDLNDLKYDDKTFDIVTCFRVFVHIHDFRPILKELLRVSKKYVFFDFHWTKQTETTKSYYDCDGEEKIVYYKGYNKQDITKFLDEQNIKYTMVRKNFYTLVTIEKEC